MTDDAGASAMSDDTEAAIRCPWCGRGVRLRPDDGVMYRHDNRNNSGYCDGSLMRPPSGSSGGTP